MTRSQAQALSDRLASLAANIDERDEEGEASEHELDVASVLLDAHESLEKICAQWSG
jgi:hypothetical protein